MSGLLIRYATLSDDAPLALLIKTAFAEYRGVLRPEPGALRETPASMREHFGREGHGALIAMRGGQPIGCVLFNPDDGDLYLGRLSVLPGSRGQGVAASLVAAVEAEAQSSGFSTVRLGVRLALTGNQRLFASLGYTKVSDHSHAGFSEPTWMEMRKTLASK